MTSSACGPDAQGKMQDGESRSEDKSTGRPISVSGYPTTRNERKIE